MHPVDWPMIVVRTVGQIPSEITIRRLVLLLAELIVRHDGDGAQADHAKGSTLTRVSLASFKYHRMNSILTNHPND